MKSTSHYQHLTRIMGILFLFLISISLSFGQNLFRTNYQFGVPGFPSGAIQAANGNYVFTGFSGITSSITELDPIGDIVWSKSYSPLINFMGIQPVSGGNYLASGSYGSDGMLLNLSSSGVVNWETDLKFPNAVTVGGNRAKETSDGGFILAGYVSKYDRDGAAGPLPQRDSSNVFVAKTNSSGTVLWKKVFFIDINDRHSVSDVAEVADGYIFVGSTSEAGNPGVTDGLILKTDFNGNLQWMNKFGGGGDQAFVSANTVGGEVLVSGNNGDRAWIVRVNSSGNLTWGYEYKDGTFFGLGFDVSQSYDAFPTNDGKYASVGMYLDLNTTTPFGTYLLKIEPSNGNIIFDKFYNNILSALPRGVQTTDNGYFMAMMGAQGFHLVKTDANGVVTGGCNPGGTAFAKNAYSPAAVAVTNTIYSATGSASSILVVGTLNPTEVVDCVVCSITNPTTNASPTSICGGKSSVLTASGSGTNAIYTVWSASSGGTNLGTTSGGTNLSVSPAATTTYYIEATTASGKCSSGRIPVTVTVAPTPTASISGGLLTCQNNSSTLTASSTGVTGYAWSTGASSQSITLSNVAIGTITYTVTVTNGTCTDITSVAVAVVAPPTANITTTSPICVGETVNLTATGGGTYAWGGGVTGTGATKTDTPNSNANYSVTVTVGACTDVATASVVVNNLPTVTASASPTAICIGNSATLTGGGATSYVWSSGGSANTETVSPTTTATYTVTGTDGNNCVNTATVAVDVNPLPTISIGGITAICKNSSTTLTASVSAGTATYAWSNGDNIAAANLAPLSTTTYTVTATDNNTCINTQVVTVTVNDIPTINITATNPICASDATTITASGANSYVWSTGASTSTIIDTPSNTTVYDVTATDIIGCKNTKSITVVVLTPVQASITVPSLATACSGVNFTLDALPTGATGYLWSNGATTTSITISESAAVATAFNYQVTVTTGTCFKTASTTITVNPLPTITSSNDTTICNGDNISLIASGGSSYSWNTGDGNSQINVAPTAEIVYTVTVTDSKNCSDIQNITVGVNQLPVVTITGNNEICTGQSTTLTASGATNYLWSTTETTNPITVSPTADIVYSVTGTDGVGCAGTTTYNVTVNALPNATIVGNNAICDGETTALTANGGITYLWSTTETTTGISVSPNITATGIYEVTVTDNKNCENTASTTITVNPLPTITTSNDTTTCSGDAISLFASGGVGYDWSTGDNTTPITVTPTNDSTFTVTVTDGNSCVNTANITITVNQLPSISVTGDNQICTGKSTTLTADGAVTYLWSTTETVNPVIVSPTSVSTTYSVVGTDGNGCANTASYTVSINSLPTAEITGNTIICDGDATTLAATGGVTYVWSTTEITTGITVSPSITATGVYTVTVVDANTCENSTSTTITVNPLPTVEITGENTVCMGKNTLLIAAGGTGYIWENTSTTNPRIVTPTQTTTYSVTATDANNCNASLAYTITVTPLPSLSFAGITQICSGENTTITASGAATYLWNTTETTEAITVQPETTTSYTVTGTDVLGCKSDSAITVNVTPQPVVSISNAETICENTGITLTGNGAENYLWSTTDTTQSIDIVFAADSTLILYGNNGSCTDSDTINVNVLPLPIATVTADTTIIIGFEGWLNATGGGTYAWSPTDGLSCTDCANPIVNLEESQKYCVEVNVDGCKDTACVAVTINMDCGNIFLPNAFSPNNDLNNDIIYPASNCLEEIDFSIYTRWGELVFTTTVVNEGWDGTHRGKELNTGVYTYMYIAKLIDGEEKTGKGNFTLIR